MTRAAIKAKVVVAKVKQASVPMAYAGEGRETRTFATQESAPTSNEVHLLKMEGCLKLLEDSIP